MLDLPERLCQERNQKRADHDFGAHVIRRQAQELRRSLHVLSGKAIFLGDLVDRGPDVRGVLRLVMGMVEASTALCVPGNHDIKLMHKLQGKDVQITHGLAESLEQLAAEPAEFHQQVATFIDRLVSHYVLDDGKLVVAHAGMREPLQSRGSRAVREFAL